MNMDESVRLVDDFKNPNPGTVNGNNLILLGHQIQRRIFGRGKIKHYIFQEGGTRNIWYKDSMHSAGIVAMGFSINRLKRHPKAVAMEEYARYFIDEIDPAWLSRNDFVIAKERICNAIYDFGEIKFQSEKIVSDSLEAMIEDDKKYGVMKPKNGKYFTYKVMDWSGKWMGHKAITKGVTLSWNKAEKIIDLEFREVEDDLEYADFKVYFHTVETDPRKQLTKNTIMYHFYPISDFDNPNRGVCVVNVGFPFTTTGEGIPLHIFDPQHYPDPVTSTAETIDFDAVYEHELCHGLGLPHSPHKNTKTYGNYSGMAESMFDEEPYETIPRLQAKYPKEIMSESRLKRWINYFKIRQDKY